YKHAPTGRFLLQFCRNICCEQKGASNIIAYTEKALNIKTGETTPDGLFTILQVECLGACGFGPVMLVNDDFATNAKDGKLTMLPGETLTPEHVDNILRWCYAREKEFKNEPVRDALGGSVAGHLGHPGAPGASAVAQTFDYAPPSPVLGLKAVSKETGVVLTWKGAPEFTRLVVEREEGGSWKEIGEPSVKDKEFTDPNGRSGMNYRMIATSGDRVAKPSKEEKAV
ncbi:MAG TPA: NAD(P)H-dependent oxidoreductase subunit E, partial [Fibrobacteraceae bacterium]|nr:NAD(P)H-dependent oxidoreductase subunit E [Fibrobacteraceae bacterium]